MTLSDLASIGTIVGSVAVTVTLIYVAVQVRQAERNQRAVIQQGRANRVSDAALMLSEPATAAIWGKGLRQPEAFSNEELDRFLTLCRAAFISAEDSFLQNKAGLLDGASFRSFALGARGQFSSSPGMRAAWRLMSTQFDPDFTRFMDDLLRDTPPGSAQDRLARWVALLQSDQATAPANY